MLKLKNIFAAAAFCAAISAPCLGSSFDRSLESLSRQYKNGENKTILRRLTALKPSEELKDIFLYMKAETLKNENKNKEAIKAYSSLIEEFPYSEAAKRSHMTLFLLRFNDNNGKDLTKLAQYANALPSSLLRAKAFEKLSFASVPGSSKRSEFAAKAVHNYKKSLGFGGGSVGANCLVTSIWRDPENYIFSAFDMFELLSLTREENLLNLIYEDSNITSDKIDKELLNLFRGVYQCGSKKSSEGFNTLSEIAQKGSSPAIRFSALKYKAAAHFHKEEYESAAKDFKKLLSMKEAKKHKLEFQLKEIECNFNLKRDQECIKQIHAMIKDKKLLWKWSSKLYHMGLECFDNMEYDRALSYFKFYEDNFKGHYRADDALGYAVKAAGGIKTKEGARIYKYLCATYTNSFFLYWLNPSFKTAHLRFAADETSDRADEKYSKKIDRIKKLMPTPFADIAKIEIARLTENNPLDYPLYKTLIQIATNNDDYRTVCSCGERLARQLLESGKPLSRMPIWAWKAMYPRPWNNLLKRYAKKYAIEIEWLRGIMREESHFDPTIISKSDARSLMQILPKTGKWIAGKLGERGFESKQLFDKETNIKYGAWYLRYLYDYFNGNMILATAAYNGGQGNITRKVEAVYSKLPPWDRIDKVPMSETRDYYKKVLSSYYIYKRLYR